MIVAGIGCRRGSSADEVLAAVNAALEQHGVAPAQLKCLATGSLKASEAGIVEAAKQLGVPLKIISAAELTKADNHAISMSEKSLELAGVGSLSESAAIAAAGPGAALLGPRLVVGSVTCALARGGETQ